MANKSKALDKLIKDFKRQNKEKEKESLTYVPQKQIKDMSERIESSDRGNDTRSGEEIRDDRNKVEQLLNLTPDQNVIKDVFELLDRPQKALFAGAQEAIAGGDIIQGVSDGFTGHNKLTFKNVLGELGMDEDEFITKALGLGGDIFLDPLKAVKFGGASKVAKAEVIKEFLDKTAEAEEAREALNALKNTKEVLTATDLEELTKLDRVLAAANKGRDNAFEAYSELREGKTLSQWVFTGVKNSFKKGATVTDAFITNSLTKIDKLKNSKMVEQGLILEAEKQITSLERYNGVKDQLNKMFNINATLPKELLSKSQEIQGRAANARLNMSSKLKVFKEELNKYAEKMQMPLEELDKNILFFEEYMNYTSPDSKSLDALLTGNLIQKVGVNKNDAEAIDYNIGLILGDEKFSEIIGTFGEDSLFTAKAAVGDTPVYRADKGLLKKVVDEIKLIEESLLENPDPDRMKFHTSLMEFPQNITPLYTPEQLELAEKLFEDENFKEIYNKAIRLRDDMASIIDYELDTMLLNNQVEGYMKHAVTEEFKIFTQSKEYELAKKHLGEFNLDEITVRSLIAGDTSVLATRGLPASVEEVNNLFTNELQRLATDDKIPEDIRKRIADKQNMKMFQDTFTSSMEDYLIKVPTTVEKLRTLEESMFYAMTQSDKFLIKPSKNITDKIPYGFDKVDTESLIKKLESPTSRAYMSYNKETIERITNFVKSNYGDSEHVYISENLNRMIGVLNRDMSSAKDNPLLGAVGALTNLFKKLKLSNIVGTQTRNVIGNTTNLMLGGMSGKDIAKYNSKSFEILSQADNLFLKQAREGVEALTDKEREILKTYEDFIRRGFQRDLSIKMLESTESYQNKFKKMNEAKLLGKTADVAGKMSPAMASTRMNAYMDDVNRLAAFMFAEDNPEIYLKLGLKSPAEYVRYTMFDPDALTPFERNTLRQIVPFYTFGKLNLQYHTKNIIKNTDKYRDLNRLLDSAWSNVVDDPETQVEDFKKENMWIPLIKVGDDGEYYAVKANLPPSDFFQMLENPLKEGISKLNPLIKAPLEIGINREFFSGQEISSFKGQADYQMPELSAKTAYGLRQTGLDVPFKAGYDIYDSIVNQSDREPLDRAVSAVFNPILNKGSAERAERRKSYQELDKLKDAVALYEQKGYYIKTLKQAREEKTVKRIDRILQDIRKRTGLRR